MATLRITTSGAPERVVPVSGTVTVGRATEHHVSLPDDTAVSRDHARITEAAGRFAVEDTESRNGTFVMRGGRTQRVSGSVSLAHGDTIIVGASRLHFEQPEVTRDPSIVQGDQEATQVGVRLPNPRG